MRHCTFVSNTAGSEGGAIQSWGDSPLLLIENSTFAANRSDGAGSAIDCGAASMTFRYVTIAANDATNGRALVIYKNPVTMVNSIILGNDNNGIGSVNGGMFNTAQSTNNLLGPGPTAGLTDGTNGNRTGVTLEQADIDGLEDNGGPTRTFRLGGNSIAIDAGVNIAGVTTDQRGIARPQLFAPDIGAYELAAGAGSLVVTTTVDENNGTSDPAFGNGTSLREAIIFAQSLGGARTITFAPWLAGQTVTLTSAWDNANGYNSSSAVRIDGNITIEGPATAPGVTLKVGDTSALRHFVISGGGVLNLQNLTLTGGKPTLSGFDFGGAVWNFGTLAVRNCTFTGNTAMSEGGAIQSWGESPSLLIETSTFTGNHSDGLAGAIDCGAVSMTFRHVTISNNTSPDGNALVIYKYPLTMLNSLIAGNGNEGVGSSNGGSFSAQSTNNILSSATAPGLTNGVSDNQLGVPVNQLWLGPLADNAGPMPTIALIPGSLAIDAGITIDGVTADQRGTARPQQSLPDIGAFELVQVQAAAPVIYPGNGHFEHAVQISMTTSSSPNAVIRYSYGGEPPTPTTGELYTGPYWLADNKSIWAITCGRGWIPSEPTLINVSTEEPLDFWGTLHGDDGGDLLGNPAGDGVVTLLKYAFNLAPDAGDLLKANQQILGPNGTAGLPAITRDAQGRLVFAFLRRKATTNPGVTYIPESSTDLLTWTPVSLTNATIVSVNSVWERVTVVDPVVSARRFGRVNVTTLGTYYNDFDRGAGPCYDVGSAKFVNGAVELTDGVTAGQLGTLIIDAVDMGEPPVNEAGEPVPGARELTGFTARFHLILSSGATGTPGDGVSFAVGKVATRETSPDPFTPTSVIPWGEAGPGTDHSLAVGFDTYDNGGAGSIGIHVWVNGTHVASSPVNPFTNGAVVPIEITWEGNSALTVKFNGTTIFDRLPISGFQLRGDTENYDEDEFGFGARTSSVVQRALVDDVQIEPRF